MSRFLKALLITGIATGAAAVLLRSLDLESAQPEIDDDIAALGFDPNDIPDEDAELLLKELASHLM
ncbi:hypothetical protein CRI94_04575 [Longibacter salinarum]|uniref:Uncharacterized protein n=1 Tax=Longibacter salinarum TaxID=1850348 RepID=A0A2A8D0Z7_9BACT|nr:hypothetical protein [Longibacter salinarum]PEN14318.1 hypothetical protein CRI94_04575 [Longibacter salinarum]